MDLEEGMPTVEQARLRMNHELQKARLDGCTAVKLIHGYGSSGVGGALRMELQHELRKAARDGVIRAFVAGEDWRIGGVNFVIGGVKRQIRWQVGSRGIDGRGGSRLCRHQSRVLLLLRR